MYASCDTQGSSDIGGDSVTQFPFWYFWTPLDYLFWGVGSIPLLGVAFAKWYIRIPCMILAIAFLAIGWGVV